MPSSFGRREGKLAHENPRCKGQTSCNRGVSFARSPVFGLHHRTSAVIALVANPRYVAGALGPLVDIIVWQNILSRGSSLFDDLLTGVIVLADTW
jgi:hypothetical protein